MNLTQKETGLLKDLKDQEQLCVDKYTKYSNDACSQELKDLFCSIAKVEQNHYNTISAMLNGTVPAGRGFVDGSGVGDVGAVVLRDRKHLAEDGMVVVVLPISAHDGYMLAEPEIITRGFIYVKESEELMNELKTVVMSAAEGVLGRRSRDIGELKGAIKSGVSNYLFKTTKRSPMVIPVITKL